MSRGILAVLSGFSGAGKGTIMKRLLEKYPDKYALSISATTRAPREGEQEGVHYFFKTKEEFEQLIKDDMLFEHAKYVDNYYGTPKAYVFDQMEAGKDVLLEIEVQGALDVKKKMPETVLIFTAPPSAAELKKRLEGRGTENAETIKKRLARAAEESAVIEKYDYYLINDDLEEAVERLHRLLETEHMKTIHQTQNVKDMKKGLSEIL